MQLALSDEEFTVVVMKYGRGDEPRGPGVSLGSMCCFERDGMVV